MIINSHRVTSPYSTKVATAFFFKEEKRGIPREFSAKRIAFAYRHAEFGLNNFFSTENFSSPFT